MSKNKIPAFKGTALEKNEALKKLISDHHLVEKNDLVALSKENSNIIENLIENDPNYIDYGSITYDYLKSKKSDFDREDYMKVLRAIDIANSTNVWRYDSKNNHKKMNDIVDYISDPKNDFLNQVKDGDIDIVDKIRIISGGNTEINDGEHSFSSKVCKYWDEYSNSENNNNYENKFFIDDYYIRRMLPYYLNCYGIKTFEYDEKNIDVMESTTLISNLTYEKLFALLEMLRKESENLTRSQLDHIIWYCYKSYDK